MREITLNGKRVADDTPAFVIAEIGNNHQGQVDIAKEMFRTAKECGADAVKLQKRDNRSLFTRELYDSPYTGENSYGPTYGAHREALEFGREQFLELKDYAAELGLTMFSTAFDEPSVDFLEALGMPFYKVASADLTNLPLILRMAETGKPVILSTGGGGFDHVRRVVEAVLPVNPRLALLQCTACYPVERYEDMNLRVIESYRREFPDLVVGLSDHESGIAMASVAFTLGARIIEKHFTLNRSWRGTDHAFSLAPGGLRRLVRDLRRAHLALGDGVKAPAESEKRPLLKMSKKIVAARDLPAGRVLERTDLAFKSPGDGLPPCDLDRVLGKALVAGLKEDAAVTLENLQ